MVSVSSNFVSKGAETWVILVAGIFFIVIFGIGVGAFKILIAPISANCFSVTNGEYVFNIPVGVSGFPYTLFSVSINDFALS